MRWDLKLTIRPIEFQISNIGARRNKEKIYVLSILWIVLKQKAYLVALKAGQFKIFYCCFHLLS